MPTHNQHSLVREPREGSYRAHEPMPGGHWVALGGHVLRSNLCPRHATSMDPAALVYANREYLQGDRQRRQEQDFSVERERMERAAAQAEERLMREYEARARRLDREFEERARKLDREFEMRQRRQEKREMELLKLEEKLREMAACGGYSDHGDLHPDHRDEHLGRAQRKAPHGHDARSSSRPCLQLESSAFSDSTHTRAGTHGRALLTGVPEGNEYDGSVTELRSHHGRSHYIIGDNLFDESPGRADSIISSPTGGYDRPNRQGRGSRASNYGGRDEQSGGFPFEGHPFTLSPRLGSEPGSPPAGSPRAISDRFNVDDGVMVRRGFHPQH